MGVPPRNAKGDVTLYMNLDPATLTESAFPFKGIELANYARKQVDHHRERAVYYRRVFLAQVVQNLPKGVSIDVNQLDIDEVEINAHQGTMSSATYSGVVGNAGTEAKRKYDQHRNEERRMYRYQQAFAMDPGRAFPLTFLEMEEFGIFELPS